MYLDDLLKQYKRYAIHERGITVKAWKAINTTMCKLITHVEANKLSQLKEAVIRDFLYYQKERFDWSAKTFRNNRQYISSFFAWLLVRGYLKKNPVEAIAKPKLPKNLPRFITREQLKEVLFTLYHMEWRYEFQKVRNEAIIQTFVYTGMRLNELSNLRFEDVNLNDETIFIAQGKGNKQRIIPMHPKLVRILRGYVRARSKQRASEWFFSGLSSDKKLGNKNIQQVCQRVSREAEVKFTPHMLRHTFGRLSIEGGLGIYKLKEIMGHENVSTTQRYLSVSHKNLKESFDKITLI